MMMNTLLTTVSIPIEIKPQYIAILKYYIEAQDNIGYLRVLNPHIALLHAITTYHQKNDFLLFLNSIINRVPFVFKNPIYIK